MTLKLIKDSNKINLLDTSVDNIIHQRPSMGVQSMQMQKLCYISYIKKKSSLS